jgi:hypothetical protein
MARSRARGISKRRRLRMSRGNGWLAPFGASPPFRAATFLDAWWWAKLGRTGVARTMPLIRHCERQRSNPGGLREYLDCFVAIAPRNDEAKIPSG